jgi:hypothetical protein
LQDSGYALPSPLDLSHWGMGKWEAFIMKKEDDVARGSLLNGVTANNPPPWPEHHDVDPRSVEGCFNASSEPDPFRRGLGAYSSNIAARLQKGR